MYGQVPLCLLYNAFLMLPARTKTMLRSLIAIFFFAFLPCSGAGQQATAPATAVDLSGLRWRMIGPFRGGRSIAVSGIQGDANTYYFGGVAGGVWKTQNGGLTWNPIFDSQQIASIGAIAVAPSDANIIYVG